MPTVPSRTTWPGFGASKRSTDWTKTGSCPCTEFATALAVSPGATEICAAPGYYSAGRARRKRVYMPPQSDRVGDEGGRPTLLLHESRRPVGIRRTSSSASGARQSVPAHQCGSSGEKDPRPRNLNHLAAVKAAASATATAPREAQALFLSADRVILPTQLPAAFFSTRATRASPRHDVADNPAI